MALLDDPIDWLSTSSCAGYSAISVLLAANITARFLGFFSSAGGAKYEGVYSQAKAANVACRAAPNPSGIS